MLLRVYCYRASGVESREMRRNCPEFEPQRFSASDDCLATYKISPMNAKRPNAASRTFLISIGALILLALGPFIAKGDEPPSFGADAFVSREFLRSGFSQTIDKISPISVCIDRYRVSGSAHLIGTMSFAPLLADNQIRLRMTLCGSAIACDSTLYRSLTIYTLDCSNVQVAQEVTVTGSGIEAGSAAISAPTRSQLLNIETGRPPVRDALFRRLGRARFERRPEESNRLATNVSEIALRDAAKRDTADMLAQANSQLHEQVLDPLRFLDISVRDLHLASTESGVVARLNFPGKPRHDPPALSDGIDVGIRGHQDALNQIIQHSLGGRTIQGPELEILLNDVYQLLNVSPARVPDKRKWSIRLAKQEPLTVRFERDQIELTIHGDGYTIDAEQYPAMDIVVRFSIQKTEKGLRTLRQFPIVSSPDRPGVTKGTGRQRLVLSLFLAKKFADLIPLEIDVTKLRLPPPLPQNMPGKFTRAVAQDGWLVLEWQLTK